MAKIPTWAIGKHITAFTLVPQNIGADGTLTDATTNTLVFYGHLQEIEMETSVSFENISAMDRPFENNVPYEVATTYRVTEIDKYTAPGSLSAKAMFELPYSIWKITLTRGANTWTGYCIPGNYRFTGTKPRVTSTFELKMVDAGVANPTYA